MLFSNKADTAAVRTTEALTADAGKIRLGGGFRAPAKTADGGKMPQAGNLCVSEITRDRGKVRLGGGFRLPVTKI